MDNRETARSAEAIRKERVEKEYEVRPPPRLAGDASADVRIRSGENEKVRLDIDTSEGRGSGWPSEEDWKRWLKAAAPWLVAAAVIALGASAYKNKEEDETVGDAARRAKNKAKDSAQRGWFGIKRGAEDAADRAEEKARQARDKASQAVEEAKGGWFGVKRGADEAAQEAGSKWADTKSAAARKGHEAAEAGRGAVARTEEYVADKAHDARAGARAAGHYVGDKLQGAAEATKGAAHATADATRRAAQTAEESAARAGSKALAKASEAEEVTGRTIKEGGERLEKDGAAYRRYYSGEAEPKKKKWFGLF